MSSHSVKPTKADQDKSEAWFPRIELYDLPGQKMLSLNKANWQIDKRRCALLVHDMQNFWVDRFMSPDELVKNISNVIEVCRAHDIPIIYSIGEKVRNRAERGLALDLWGPGIGAVGGVSDLGAQILSSLEPMESDYVVEKSKYSAFFNTSLEKTLRITGRSQLLISGIFAHHGCLATALDAYMRNVEVFFIADATADYSRAEHEMAIRYVAETSGVITTVSRVENELSSF